MWGSWQEWIEGLFTDGLVDDGPGERADVTVRSLSIALHHRLFLSISLWLLAIVAIFHESARYLNRTQVRHF
jgi:hypothetical protein